MKVQLDHGYSYSDYHINRSSVIVYARDSNVTFKPGNTHYAILPTNSALAIRLL